MSWRSWSRSVAKIRVLKRLRVACKQGTGDRCVVREFLLRKSSTLIRSQPCHAMPCHAMTQTHTPWSTRGAFSGRTPADSPGGRLRRQGQHSGRPAPEINQSARRQGTSAMARRAGADKHRHCQRHLPSVVCRVGSGRLGPLPGASCSSPTAAVPRCSVVSQASRAD